MSPPGAEPSTSAAANDSVSPGSDDTPITDNPVSAVPAGSNTNVPKPKRLACTICRKRKLRCDGVKPSCSTCTRLGHSCAYDEVRRKSGPKRGYVKALEERLKQVETLLKTQEPAGNGNASASKTSTVTFEQPQNSIGSANFNVTTPNIALTANRDLDQWHTNDESPQNGSSNNDFNPTTGATAAAGNTGSGMDDFSFNNNISMGMNIDNSFTWEMIGLGLEEPLPPQETIDELHQIFFEKVHPSIPMIHKYRYLAAMNLAPNQRPPVALRYAIWTLACSITEKYVDLKDLFYQRARKYVEADYIKGYGEHMISVAHAQTHALLASYEFKMMYFPRAWQSTGSAARLGQMIGLHRLDRTGLEVKQCLPPPRDWTEKEERRRTFWMAFCMDRYASIGTGWPMIIDERDIMTNLPASEEAFEMSRPEQTQTLVDSMSPSGAAKLSPYGSIVLMACLFGRNLVHLHRPDADDRDHDLNGEFWKRHRNMDNILLNTSLCLPNHLKLPVGLGNPNIIFTNMNIHTSTICLHQAAIFKADKNRLPASVSAESKVRCITAANEVASIMKMVSHMDLSTMNPFISFCLYVAARVFVQYLKSRPDDSQTADSLRFLLAAMNALKRKNPLTESFLVQLDVDLEALGMRIPKLKSAFPRSGDCTQNPTAPQLRKYRKNPNCDGLTAQNSPFGGYQNEGTYSAENGNPANTHGIGDNDKQNQMGNGQQQRQCPNNITGQDWMPEDQQIPTRERACPVDLANGNLMIPPDVFGTASAAARGFMDSSGSSGEANDMSPNTDGISNRPTPNSSTASDHRQSVTGTSGNTPFDTSPIGSNRNLGAQAEIDAATASSFFPDSIPASFHLSGNSGGGTGLTPGRTFAVPDTPSNDFNIPNGWASQTMTPVAEGMLRHLMDMPMDSMDLSGWDSGT